MGPENMTTIARLIYRGLQAAGNESALMALRAEVAEFCRSFPLHK
jgi:glycine/serine hydroxymethyltransferase